MLLSSVNFVAKGKIGKSGKVKEEKKEEKKKVEKEAFQICQECKREVSSRVAVVYLFCSFLKNVMSHRVMSLRKG